MGAGAGGNAPALQKRIRHLAGIQVPDVQGHDGRPARGGKVAIHPDAGKLPDAPVKPQHQPVLPGVQAFHPLCQQVFQSGVKPRQAMTVQGSGLQAGGIGGGLIPVEGVNAAAAPQQGPDLHPRADTQAAGALGASVAEMERRYKLFAENNVREIKAYNKLAAQTGMEHLPYIAIVIDELADLMMVAGKEVEDYICRIAQKARAAGIHLIVATQRPSVDVITGLIKANIPSRIAFAVSSQIDSRTILDAGGAEKLLGKLESEGTLTVIDKKGAQKTDALCTGDSVRNTYSDGFAMFDLPIIIYGDIDGNGKIDKDDIAALQKHLIRSSILGGPYLIAADVNHDETVDIMDMIRLIQYVSDDAKITQED